jgi:hypothetical protein
LTSKAGGSRLMNARAVTLLPDNLENTSIVPVRDLPGHLHASFLFRQRAVFGRICCQFVHHQTERRCNIPRQDDGFAVEFQPGPAVAQVGSELPFDQPAQVGASPDGVDKQLLGIRKGLEPSIQFPDKLRHARTALARLVHHALYNSQQIFYAVR